MENDEINRINDGLINRNRENSKLTSSIEIKGVSENRNYSVSDEYEDIAEAWRTYNENIPRDEPKYDNMHATNIKLTKKAIITAMDKFIIKTAALFAAGALIVGGGIVAKKIKDNYESSHGDNNKIVSTNKGETSNLAPITLDECDFSNFTIVLRQSTPNVDKIVSTTEEELTKLGVDNRVITSKDNLIEEITELKTESPEKDIIVINVDGYANNTAIENVIMTNYDNDVRSADSLAIAISSYNPSKSEIRCGKSDSYGGRTRTSVEVLLNEANFYDVTCLTVAPTRSIVDSEQNTESIATSIVDGVIRYASLRPESRNLDIIRRVEYGDTISQLAENNNVSQQYIMSENKEVLSESGNLKNDVAIIVKEIPENLTSSIPINKYYYTM